MRFSITFLFLFVTSLCSFAQQPITIHLTEKDGLPDIEFYDILEDNDGFIWMAADKGLFRYDGETFKRFTNDEVRGKSMFELRLDDQGNVWCVNLSGQFFYAENDKLVTFIDLSEELNGELPDYEIIGNELYIFSRSVFIKLNNKTATYKKTPQIIGYIKPLKTDTGVIYSEESLLFKKDSVKDTNLGTAVATLIDTFRNQNKIIEKKLTFFESDHKLFAFSRVNEQNLFFKFSSVTATLNSINTPQKLMDASIIRVKNKGKKIIFSTSRGAQVYEIDRGAFIEKAQYLENQFVTNVIIDKDNNYWFSTLRSGIFVMPNIHVAQYEIPLEFKNISKIDKLSNTEILLGTLNGDVGVFSIKNDVFKTIDGIKKSSVSALFYDKNTNKALVGMDNKGYVYDFDSQQATYVENFAGAKSFSIPKKDTLLMIKGRLIAKRRFSTIKERQIALVRKRGYGSLYDDKTNKTYVTTIDGLDVYDENFNVKTIKDGTTPLLGIGLTKTADGILWMASFKNGLYGIKNDTVVAKYSKVDGLSANEVNLVAADGNNLWIATDGGIQFLDSATTTFKTLTKKDGIPSYKISGIEIFEDYVVFSSNLGLFSVNKKEAFRSTSISNVYIQNVAIDEQIVTPSRSYRVAADEKKIKFDFHTNNFQNLENITYQYLLHPETTSWTTLGKGVSNVQFNNLNKGNYILDIRAKNTFSENHSTITSVPFVVAIAVWEEVWFQALLIFAAIGLIVLNFRSTLNKRQKKQELALANAQVESRMTALKLENLRSQMNPHFIFNALNSIQEYILLNQKSLASDYLGKFADLVRTYLKHSNTGEISLQEEINCLEMYLDLEKLRFEEKLEYYIDINSELSPESVLIPTMLIQPYVENAIKHGLLHKKENRRLWVRFHFGNVSDIITCEIEDNGVGREKALAFQKKRKPHHKSFATEATDDRLVLINNNKDQKIGVATQDLRDANNNSVGTKVTITIPFKEE